MNCDYKIIVWAKIISCNGNFDTQSSEFWLNKPFNLILILKGWRLMTVAKIGTRLGGYLAFKHYQGNTNVTNPGRAACASHTGGGAVRAMSSLLMRVQEFRIWGYIKASTPCALCSRLTVWKSRSVERKTLSQTCSSCFGVRTTRCPHPTPEGTDQCPDILELLIGDGEDRECCSSISLPSSPPSLSSQFWFAEVFV